MTASIHDFEFLMGSGSKAGDTQFALLRQVWKGLKEPFDRKDVSNSTEIVSKDFLELARTLLDGDRPWKEYLNWLDTTPTKEPLGPEAEAMGRFALVLQSQQNTEKASSGIDNDKSDYSPAVTRSQTRRLRFDPSFRPQTPTPVPSSQRALANDMDKMEIEDLSPTASSVEQPSPLTGESAKQEGEIKNEQEVVFSLILFQRAVCSSFREVAKVAWLPDQDTFVARNKTGEKTFTARVDGVMRLKGSTRTPLFDETKKANRFIFLQGAQIRAQESCQLAAKIAQEASMISSATRQKDVKKQVWVAQDKNEIYIMVGTYGKDYVSYISHKPAPFSLAQVQEYGPYSIGNPKLMEELGIIILALALQEVATK